MENYNSPGKQLCYSVNADCKNEYPLSTFVSFIQGGAFIALGAY